MFCFSKMALAALVLGTGFLIVGCQSDGAQAPASHEMASDAVHCDKCDITYVKVPSGTKQGSIVQYNWVKKDSCPDCKSAVSTFFATGKLEHSCKSCGGNLAACAAH